MGLLFVASASAQQLYRQVGPDGRVTFTDRPPASPEPAAARANRGDAAKNTPAPTAAASTTAPAAASALGTSNLPYELRQAIQRYPVTLYTREGCTYCGSARAMLSSRGVPFAEKTISSREDLQSLKQLSGETTLPFATIGSQQLKGYSDSEWTQYLDAAGYPKQSKLPRSYRNPAPAPLVARAPAAAAPEAPAPAQAAASGATPAAPAAPTVAPPITAENPTGLRF